MSIGTKIFTFLAVALLFCLALDITYINLYIAKLTISVSAIYLFVVAARTREKIWLIFFALTAIFLNPVYDVLKLTKTDWRIIDLVIAVGFILFFYRYYDSYRKGSNFEKFVANLFPPEMWVIEDWTKDKSRGLRRKVESDNNPDLTVRSLNNNKRYAIECKFRSRFWTTPSGTGIFWNAKSHDFYKKYGEKEKISVRVVFGVGGNPKHPVRIFIVPLEKLEQYKGGIIPAQYIGQFEKNSKNPISLE